MSWPLVVFQLARRPRALIAISLAISLCAMLARLTGSLMGLGWWTTYVLTPSRLDGLALGAFLAVRCGPTISDYLWGAITSPQALHNLLNTRSHVPGEVEDVDLAL